MEKELLIEVKNMTKFFRTDPGSERSKPEVLPRRDSWTNRGERKRKVYSYFNYCRNAGCQRR